MSKGKPKMINDEDVKDQHATDSVRLKMIYNFVIYAQQSTQLTFSPPLT